MQGLGSSPIVSSDSDTDESQFTLTTIFFNNLGVVTILVLGGLLVGIPSVFGIIVNGVVIGYSVSLLLPSYDSLLAGLMTILPHVMLEFPALVLATAAGLRLPAGLVSHLRGREEVLSRRDIVDYLLLASIAIAFVSIASIIEVHLTPLIYNLVS